MRRIFAAIARVFGWLDTVEFAIPAIMAVLLLVVGPLVATLWFLRMHRYIMAAISAGLWLASALALFCDLRHRRFGWACGVAFFVWLATTLILSWKIETAAP